MRSHGEWAASLPWGVRFSARYGEYSGGKTVYDFLAGPRDGDFFGPGSWRGKAFYDDEHGEWVALGAPTGSFLSTEEARRKSRMGAVEALTGRKRGT